ncbi:DUF4336 domain-containing protein [Parasalinivibrio latis]|uniref:DUF4336 domain-containing protein n=1 Tax=Parasalinivibrio latis TaxID=2952610 RepID=UPI0030E4D80B
MKEWHKERLWYQEANFKRFGINIGVRMVVIRLNDNRLFIHSPIELTETVKTEIDRLGQISAVVTPNAHHHLFLGDWWRRYPNALFFAPPALENKRTDINFDGALGGRHTPDIWKNEIYQTRLLGSDSLGEVVFCDPLSETLILGDSLAWLNGPGLGAIVAGLASGCYFQPSVPCQVKRLFNDPVRLRQSLSEILTWPFNRVITSHGTPVADNGKAIFADAYRWAFQL